MIVDKEKWEPAEIAEAITESNRRKERYLRQIDQEEAFQGMLYGLMRSALYVKPPMPTYDSET